MPDLALYDIAGQVIFPNVDGHGRETGQAVIILWDKENGLFKTVPFALSGGWTNTPNGN